MKSIVVQLSKTILLLLLLFPCSISAAPSRGAAIETLHDRTRIVVAKQELTVEYLVAVNTVTRKRVTYGVRVKDKFEHELYRRDFDIPFSAFADGDYHNKVTLIPVLGVSGAGFAVIATLGPTLDAPRQVDLIGIRTGETTVFGAKSTEAVRILDRMPHQFVGIDGSQKVIRLGKGDTWLYRYWNGSFYLNIPLVIDWYGLIALVPMQTEFSVSVPSFRRAKGRITVYTKPTFRSNSAFLSITPTSDVRFLKGYGKPVLAGQTITVSQSAIRVEVDGRSGWVIDPESFAALGLKMPAQ